MLIHLQQPKAWQGVILNGAPCGIGKFKPSWPAEHLLYLVAWLGKEGEHKEEHRCLHLVAAAFERLHYPEIVLIVV